MATTFSLLFRLLFFFFFLTISDSAIGIAGAGVGINYGQIANNLPSPSRVAVMLRSLNITRVKLYDADPKVLAAFSNTDVDFVIGLGNEQLRDMTDPEKAQIWIQQRIEPYLPRTKIRSIVVGNEVFKSYDAVSWSNLLPAMQTIHNALLNLKLDNQVTVTTAHSFDILAASFPPSSGTFRQEIAGYIQPLLNFHSKTNSPFLINAYPFFAYKDSPNEIPLNYALFQPNQGTVDGGTNLRYDNMLYAQVDAVYFAMKAMGHSNIEVKISETGWPSKGDENEIGASPENARLYNGNLLQRMAERQGTPANPHIPIDIYVFALFNENLKPGPVSERNYGLFYPDGTPVYNIGLQGYLPEIVYTSSTHRILIRKLLWIYNVALILAMTLF